MPLLFSVITPCLNRADTVARAIDSVLAQNYSNFEHIVIDGGSTDGTLGVLAGYPHLQVVSEPDRNLYDAINKGLRRARGDVVGLLNSDDRYAPGAFAAAAAGLADPTVQLVVGGAEIFTRQGETETVTRRYLGPRATSLDEANAIGNVTLINSCFWRRSLHARFGVFDDRFRLAADKDFWMRLALGQPEHRYLPRVLYRYLSHDGSLTFSDNDMRDVASEHLLTLARTRLAESPPGTAAFAAYRRWHAWAAGYRAGRQIARGRLLDAIATARQGFATDATWPLRFLMLVPGHWRDRDVRRGAP